MPESYPRPFLWLITPSLEVQAIKIRGHILPVLIWHPTCPPRRSNDPTARILARLNQLQASHPKAARLALLAKAVSEILPLWTERSML